MLYCAAKNVVNLFALNAILCDPFDLDILSGFESPQEKGQRNSGTADIRVRRFVVNGLLHL
jgi:hypothetical protein